MKLLDRYLQAVKKYLPKGQRDDIVRELSDAILSAMEDQEAELGRPLTEAEQEAILQRHGTPLGVAGRYLTDQRSVAFGRQLIGPVLFPIYIKILSLNLAITIVVCAITAVAFASGEPLRQMVSAILFQFTLQFAIITGIFTLAERSGEKFLDTWKPRPLLSTGRAKADRLQIPRSQSIAELIFLGVFLYCLPALPCSPPRMVFGDGAAALLKFGPGSQFLFQAIPPLVLMGVIRSCILVVGPHWVRFHWVMRLAATSASLVVLGLSLQAGQWLLFANPGGDLANNLPALEWLDKLNHWIGFGLIATIAGCIVVWGMELRRLVRLQFPSQEDPAEPLDPQGGQA